MVGWQEVLLECPGHRFGPRALLLPELPPHRSSDGMWVVITAAWPRHLDEWAVEFGEIIKEPDFHSAPDNK